MRVERSAYLPTITGTGSVTLNETNGGVRSAGAQISSATRYTQEKPGLPSVTTACLSAIIVMQVVNVFLCRSSTRSVFSTGLFGNPLIICGVITEIALLLLINYTPWGNALLGTAGIEAQVWLFVIPFGAGMLILEKLLKWIVRRRLANPSS